jgi:hypothetical protein
MLTPASVCPCLTNLFKYQHGGLLPEILGAHGNIYGSCTLCCSFSVESLPCMTSPSPQTTLRGRDRVAWGELVVLTLSVFTGSLWETLSRHVGVSRYVRNIWKQHIGSVYLVTEDHASLNCVWRSFTVICRI